MTQLLQNAVLGTALILAAALLRRALGGRLLPEARLALWLVCLIRLLAPVFPESGLSLWGLLPRAGTAGATAPVMDPLPVPSGAGADLPAANAPASGMVNPGLMPVEPAGAAFPWAAAALSLWIGVGLVLAARYVLGWSRTRRAVAQAVPLPEDDPRYAPLPRCARLREGVMDGAPLTFGAVRPTVVLWPGLSGAALDCVLAHEAVHARRRDNLWHYAMGLALVAYWWNPAVWLMARLLRRDIELACDRAAVRRLGAERRAEYAETLVALATTGAEPAFCRTFGRKAAEERILSVMKFKKTTVLGVVLSLALVAGVTAAFASAPKAPAGQSGDPGNNTPYQVCANPLCTVGYQHCHIDGEVVRAYDQYPGLLCAHPDCEIEGPHEHDGVQYAGQAGKYVILNQDAGPVASGAPDEDSTTSSAPADFSYGISSDSESGKVLRYEINIDFLKQCLDQHVTEGAMTQAEADQVWAQAQDFAQGGKALIWSFQGDSGLTLDELHNVCYRDENGKLIPVDPATVVSGFILPNSGTVKYHGRAYNRAGLSAETLEWLDWYLALPEEERLAVSYEPAELRDRDNPAGEQGFTQDSSGSEDSAKAGDEPAIGELGGSFYDYSAAEASGAAAAGTVVCPVEGCTQIMAHQHDGRWYCFVHPVCPVEGCTVRGVHTHDGVTYSCNGAGHSVDGSCNGSCGIPVCPVEGCTVRGRHIHDGVVYRCGGDVCDGSCLVYGGGDAATACPPEAIDQNFPSRTNCYPGESGHHSNSHHGNGYHGGRH